MCRADSIRPQIIAHRGASCDAPENTIAAFREAWRQDADGIECDVHLTGDGHIVCCHDASTGRIANQNLAIANTLLDDLCQLDAGGWKGPFWLGERIPELRELLLENPRGKCLLIEIKGGPEIVKPLIDLLAQTGSRDSDHFCILSFSPSVIRAWRRSIPQGRACLLLEAGQHGITSEQPAGNDLTELVHAAGANAVGLEYTDSISAATISMLVRAGIETFVWTVDTPEHINRCIRLGVNAIITNSPGLARRQLSQYLADTDAGR